MKWFPSLTTQSPSRLLVKVLATIGILIFIDRAASYYALNPRDRYTTAAGSGIRPFESHSLDKGSLPTTSNTRFGFDSRKAVVVASLSTEDTSWIQKHLSDWEDYVYVVDDPNANLTVFNRNGREASAYLTYIISQYHVLPDYIAFLQAERYQWHNDDPMYDGVMPMKNLRLEYVKKKGYVSLRCSWNPGCPAEIQPDPEIDDGLFGYYAAYADAFQYIFPDNDMPELVGTTCCAQFVVTKETITNIPLQTWELARQWLWETEIGDLKSGKVMEFMWHILMGQPDLLCPNAEECYCRTFGLCNLECFEEGFCEGRYKLPGWDSKMPEGWPFEGQGEKEWPKYGWWQGWYPDEDFGLEYIKDGPGADVFVPPNTFAEVPDIDVDPDELVASVMGEPLSKAPNMEPELIPIDEGIETMPSNAEDDGTYDIDVIDSESWSFDEVDGKSKNYKDQG